MLFEIQNHRKDSFVKNFLEGNKKNNLLIDKNIDKN
jgi:hypothetical protein